MPTDAARRHLLSIEDLNRPDLERVLDLTDSFAEVSQRRIPRVPALRGKTVAMLFYEDSTRTRLSFEVAARRLSADVMGFSVSASSVSAAVSRAEPASPATIRYSPGSGNSAPRTSLRSSVGCVMVSRTPQNALAPISRWVSKTAVATLDL